MSTLKANGVTAQTTNSALTLTGNGSGLVTIGDGALTFPDADGSASQVIQTNGSGALSFATAASSPWTLIGTDVAPGGAGQTVLNVGSIPTTYDTLMITGTGILPITDNADFWMRFGDSGGIDSGAADYSWIVENIQNDGAVAGLYMDDVSDARIQFTSGSIASGPGVGNAAGEGFGFTAFINSASDDTQLRMITWTGNYVSPAAQLWSVRGSGRRLSAITMTQIEVYFHSGNVEVGTLSVWGLSNA